MPDTPVTVRFNKSDPDCVPEPAIVNKGLQDGIRWKGNQPNYTFTKLYIGGVAASVGDFGTPVITSTGPLSVMRVDDACTIPKGAEYVEYKYTLEYTDPDGATLTLDPRIRHRK